MKRSKMVNDEAEIKQNRRALYWPELTSYFRVGLARQGDGGVNSELTAMTSISDILTPGPMSYDVLPPCLGPGLIAAMESSNTDICHSLFRGIERRSGD